MPVISSRMVAWMVTSSAVVGSSAIRKPGLQRQRHRQHDALAHAAGEFVHVAVEPLARRGDADQRQQLDDALARLLPWRGPRLVRSASEIWSHTVNTGLSALIGSWNTMAMRRPRSARISASLLSRMSLPSNSDAAVRDLAGRVGDQAHDRLAPSPTCRSPIRPPGRRSRRAAIEKDTPSTAVRSPRRRRKRTVSSSSARTVSAMISAPPAAGRGCRAGRRRTG